MCFQLEEKKTILIVKLKLLNLSLEHKHKYFWL